MTPPQFTLLTQKLGISLSRVSVTNALALAEIETTPLPLTPRASRKKGIRNETRTNDKPHSVGPLIAHGLLELVREAGHYAVTAKGRDYLTLLRHHNILNL